MIRRPPRSTPFPTRRSSDLRVLLALHVERRAERLPERGRLGEPFDRGVPEEEELLRVGDLLGGADSGQPVVEDRDGDRKSTRLNSSHGYISYAVFCLKKKKK